MSRSPEGAPSNAGQNMLEHPALGIREIDDGDVSPAKAVSVVVSVAGEESNLLLCTSHDADAVQRGVVVGANEVVRAPRLQANVPNVPKVGHQRRLEGGK